MQDPHAISSTPRALMEAGDAVEGICIDDEEASYLLTCLSPLEGDVEDDTLADSTLIESSETTFELSSASAQSAIPCTWSDQGSSSTGVIVPSSAGSEWRFGASISSSPSRSIDAAQETTQCKRPRRSDSNKAREQRRQELLRLRETVAQLEQELSTLKLQPGSATALVKRSKPDGGKRTRVHGPWATIAEHQRRERLRVEEENIQLRVELNAQLQLAGHLERVLQQSLRQRTQAASGLVRRGDTDSYPAHLNDPAVWEALLHAMELRYQNVDAIFDDLGISDMEYSHNGTRIKPREFGVDIEVFHNEVLPVPISVASDAVWREFPQNMARIPYRKYYERTREVVFSNKDTLLEYYGFKLRYNGQSAHFRVQQVLRRFVEADRVAIMWSSKLHTVEYSEGPMTGTFFRRNACMLFKRPKTLDSSEFTILKMSNMITPMFDGSYFNPDGTMTKGLTDFLLVEGAASAAIMHQLIENTVLREAPKWR
ncbi:hypothetical protein Poli38472_000484 [Pythium oligandrum]|uniref:M96 mating-specific protein family n=1 Tax=Pythium oligandrum TaxID=41045 RepID=A0A8K1CC10_PYTOL|nr:hypothetical protein Poli38472_000484 [Pythium oligandrum]|eukprot:TMW60442.1 hypothetical protein Poli38472_000484 [Pythium oligandrum]